MTLMSKTKIKHQKMSPAIHLRAQDNPFTFDTAKVKDYVTNHILSSDRVLNLFAGMNVIVPWELRVDSNHAMNQIDLIMDVESFLKIAIAAGMKFDKIIYDPPWNARKSKEFYNGHYIGKFTKLKDDIVSLLEVDGKIISCGYEIDNFGKGRGMQLQDVVVVNPSGEKRSYHITIERKVK